MVVVIAHLEQPVARAQRALQRRNAAGMFAVDRQHQPVEEPPALGRGAEEQPVHGGRQPDHAQMIAERGRRAHRLAVDAAAPAGRGRLAAGRVEAGAERGQTQRALDLGGDRPGAVALIVGDVFQRGAPKPASRRQKRDRLEAIGLAGAVRPDQHHDVAARLQTRRAIIAEVRQRQPVDAGGGHLGRRAIFLPSPLVGEGGASRSEATGEGFLRLGELCENVLQDSRGLLQHVIVPVTRDSKSFGHQDSLSGEIAH